MKRKRNVTGNGIRPIEHVPSKIDALGCPRNARSEVLAIATLLELARLGYAADKSESSLSEAAD
jgi:hypothetical protein